MNFDGGEVLSVWSPRNPHISKAAFQIGDAARVRWEWFRYGRPQIPENRYFYDFSKNTSGIEAMTNVDWYNEILEPRPTHPAVEIL